jgi:hypothetical protein
MLRIPIAAVLLIAASSAVAQQSVAPMRLTAYDQRLLDLHNNARSAVGAPPLRWSPVLAAAATAYARQLAWTGQLVHSPRQGRGDQRENLAETPHGSSPDVAMRNWLAERRNFVPGVYPSVSRTGNWFDVSHYSQVIWPTTNSVGCGVARGVRWDFIVCRYSPGGNKDGKPVGIRAWAVNR